MKYSVEMYLLKPEQFLEVLKWERAAKQMKEIVKAIYLSGLENQLAAIEKGTVRA